MRPLINNRRCRPVCRQRGGCLEIFGIIFLVILLLVGLGVFFTVRWAHKQVDTYTATSPVALPRATISDADYTSVAQRITQFTDALKNNQDTPPLVLNEQELNGYLERTYPDGAGKEVYIKLDGSQVKGQVSYPLDGLNLGWVKGRYLNGDVTFEVSLQDHRLVVTAQQIEVNGLQPSESFMAGFRNQNLAQNAMKDPKQAAAIAKFDSIEVKDGKLIIKAQAAPPAVTAGGTGTNSP